jgi:predicted dehydrogenase
MKTGKPVRIGLIGLGIMGELYAKIYSACPFAELVAVSSRRAEKVAEYEQRFNVKGYTDYNVMIQQAEIDAVVIATPDHAHFAPAYKALSAGKHVLIEKPLTTSVVEADQLLRLASAKKLKIQVTYNHRWLSSYYSAKSSMERGEIGEPLAAFARKNDTINVPAEMITWAAETTPAWFLSSHDIDLVRWFFASEPVEARAWGRREVLSTLGISTYDIIHAQLKFENGCIAMFESGWIYPNTFPTIVDSFVEIVGSRGHLHMDRKRESLEMSTATKFSYPKNFITQDIFGKLRGAFPSCLEDFVASILNDTEPHVTGFDGRQVTAALEAIHEALASGGTVQVKPFVA